MDTLSSNVEVNNQSSEKNKQRENGATPWVVGMILILFGGLFLMRNLGVSFFHFSHWWALFILIPVVGAAQRAATLFKQSDNQLTPQVTGAIFIAGLLSMIMLGFLFNIRLAYIGPAFFILAGLGILVYEMVIKKA